MQGVTVCETHEHERVIARCTVCGRGICKQCRDEFGYYCSAPCREKGGRRSMGPTGDEERRQMSEFGKKLDRWFGIFKWRVAPGIAGLIALVIIWKVTSDEGEVVWKFRPPEDAPFSELALAGDAVLASCGKTLRALDARTGKVRWEFEAEDKLSPAAPLAAGSGLWLVNDRASIHAVDVGKGKRSWRAAIPGPLDGALVVGGKSVVAACGVFREPTAEERTAAVVAADESFGSLRVSLGPVRTGTVIVAFGLSGGKALWSRTLEGTSPLAGMALGDGPLYTCRSMFDDEGFRTALEATDPATGEVLWTKELASASHGLLLEAGKDVLVPTGEGLVCLTPSGDERWRSPGGSSFSPPAVTDGKVYRRLGEAVACLDLGTGKELWRIAGGSSGHPFSIGDGLVFVASFRTEAMKRPKATIELPKPKAEGVEDLIEAYTKPAALPNERSVGVMKAYDAATGSPVWTADDISGRVVPAGAKVVALDTRDKFNLMDAAYASSTRIVSLDSGSGAQRWSCSRDGNVTSAVATGGVFVFASNIVATQTSAMMTGSEPPRENAIMAISLVH